MPMQSRAVTKHKTSAVPAASMVTINFSSVAYSIDPLLSFGYCVTGYTGDAGDVRFGTSIQQHAAALAAGTYRLAFKWDSVNNYPLNGASSGVGLGNDWVAGVNLIKPAGAYIVGIIEGDIKIGNTTYTENGMTPQEAANIVHYYNDNGGQHGGPIQYWMIGNEPDLAGSSKIDYLGRDLHDGRVYGDLWLEIYAAIKAADPTIKVGGPTAAQYFGHARNVGAESTYVPGAIERFWNDFLQQTRSGVGKVADLVDFVDAHYYGTGNFNEPTATVLNNGATLIKGQIDGMRSLITGYAADSAKGATIPCILSELNWAYRATYGSMASSPYALVETTDLTTRFDGRFSMTCSTVFTATTVLNALRSAGWVMIFGDVVGPLGMMTRNTVGDRTVVGGVVKYYPHNKSAGERYPAYYGLGMWTGMGLFRRFGKDIVTITGGIANMQLLASTNTRDVMVVNRDETTTRNLTLTMTGVANGTVVGIWATNRFEPWDPPRLIGTKTVASGQITGVIVPPLTVMRLIVG